MWLARTKNEQENNLTRSVYVLAASLIALFCSGCGVSRTASTAVSATQYSIVDRLDRRVTFDAPPQRIVSLSPATTELVFALGAGELLVGATEYCNFPDQAKAIDRVGSGPVGTVSLESIVSKRPDLVLCKFDTHQPLVDSLDRLNIKVLALGPESLAELCEEADWLGNILERDSQSKDLVQSLRSRAKKLEETAAKLKTGGQPTKVFYQVWADPLMTVSQGSFIDELLHMAGLQNICHEVNGRYPQVSPELVVQRDPEVILLPSPASKPVDLQVVIGRTGWQGVSAVRNKRVHPIDSDIVSRCGPRMLDAAEQIIEAVYGRPAVEASP